MSFLTGGSKQEAKAQSGNNAYPELNSALGSTVNQTGGASNAIANLLGIGADPGAQDAAFNKYRDSSGYQFQMDQGTQAITGSAAARGLLDSGSTLKGLQKYGQGLADSTFNNYLDKISGLGNMGIAAGGVLSDAGKFSNSSSSGSSKNGIGKLLGSIASGIAASDRRLKTDILKIGEYGDIGKYRWNYINGDGPYIGVMADEVQTRYPDALGPMLGDFMTVDYDKLQEAVGYVLS